MKVSLFELKYGGVNFSTIFFSLFLPVCPLSTMTVYPSLIFSPVLDNFALNTSKVLVDRHNTTTPSRQKQKGKPAVFLQQLLSSQLPIHSSNTWASFTALCSIIQERWNKSSTYSKNVIVLDEFKMFQGDLWILFSGIRLHRLQHADYYRSK